MLKQLTLKKYNIIPYKIIFAQKYDYFKKEQLSAFENEGIFSKNKLFGRGNNTIRLGLYHQIHIRR